MIEFGWIVPMPEERQINLPPRQYMELVRHGLEMISGHFHSAWCSDHLQFQGEQILEGWTMLTSLAPLHPSLAFGTLVLNQSLRNPALLAKMAATMQYMSAGRLLLGIGAGWHEEEHRSYGYPFPSGHVRVAQLQEVLVILTSLWTQPRTTFKGTYYQIEDARCEPKPDPLPPLILGGGKPQMLKVIAQYADWWNADRPLLAAYREQIKVCEDACIAVHRDPTILRRTWSGGCVCRQTEMELRPWRNVYSDTYGFIGTPESILEQLQPFIDLGVDYFMLHMGGFPDLTTLELLVSEVLPALQQTAS